MARQRINCCSLSKSPARLHNCSRLQLLGRAPQPSPVLPDMPVVGVSIAADCSLLQLLVRVLLPSPKVGILTRSVSEDAIGDPSLTLRVSRVLLLPSHRARRNRQRILDGKKWDWLGLFRRLPVPSRDVRRRNASGIGGAVGAHPKLLIYRFLCHHTRPTPAPLQPHESGCRIASRCLIVGRDVPRSSAADLVRCSGGSSGDLEWVERAIPC